MRNGVKPWLVDQDLLLSGHLPFGDFLEIEGSKEAITISARAWGLTGTGAF